MFVTRLLLFEGDNKNSSVQEQEVFFENESQEYGLASDNDDDRESVRAALIEKLGEHNIEDEDVIYEESVAVDNIVVEGGVLLGDGKISTSPQKGNIYSCQQNFNGGGAHAVGEWIRDGYWYPAEKVTVYGEATWENFVSISTPEGARLITANGLPDHATGIYPIRAADDAYQYDRNPNLITAQDVLLQLPKQPTLAGSPSCVSLGAVGVGLNGVAIFNGLDGMGQDAPAHEIQDVCGGHPERTGEYHYHNESSCLVDGVYEGADNTLLGYALDGFGMYSSIEAGIKLSNDDLDVCHGHQHLIPWDGVFIDMYHYHMTDEYPYSLGCFMGTPIEVAGEADIPNSNGLLPPPPFGNGNVPPPQLQL